MTSEEWQSKTDDWRHGWRYAQGDVFITPKNTPDFIEGYRYACDHPEGSYYSAGATTGKLNAQGENMRKDRNIAYYKYQLENMLDGAMFNLKIDDYHKLLEELKVILEDRDITLI